MSLALNTSHPLYSNLKLLIGVNDDNTLIDLVTPSRTFTVDPDASFGTGSFGRHFRTNGAEYNPNGASFSPAFVPANNTGTLVVVVNAVTAVYANGFHRLAAFINPSDSNDYRLPIIHRSSGGNVAFSNYNSGTGNYDIATGTSALVSSSPRMLTASRNGTTAYALYVNATSEASGTALGSNATGSITWSVLGGVGGNAGIDANIVWIAWLDKALSSAEVSDLYASLGANNAFGLVQAAGNAAPTFPGPNIGNLSGTVGTALSGNNVASKFADSDALTFSAVGSWPPGVTVSSAGVISGTPTTAGTYSGLAVRATDTAAQTVDSDTFSFTIGAAAHLITVANSQQVNTASSGAIQQSGNGTITLPALKDWGTGNLKASETGVTIIINNATTGVLVALLTGQTANASGVLPTLTGLVSGTAYRVTTILADGSEGTWKYTAS